MEKSRIALEHLARTSACRSWSVKWRHVNSAPVWTSDRLFVKIKDSAEAISSAVGFVVGDSCHRRLSSGVMETLASSSAGTDDMVGWRGSWRGNFAAAG